MNNPQPHHALIVRWLAIAGAAGAATSAAIAAFTSNSYWNTVAFVAALLAIAGVAGLWRTYYRYNEALVEASLESGEQKREVDALQQELEIHRRLERELTEAKQAAESAMMAKGEFLATMSHEIRTPLNGIIPMLELLMGSRLPADQHDFLRTAYTSSRQMLRIVDDILDYSKLEANKLQLESTSFNLRELLDSVIRLMEKPAETKGLRLNLQLDPSLRLPMRGDPVRLRQVLTNLLSNAIKFTERGAVSLIVTRKGETRTQHQIHFEVRDTGIGIDKESRQNLFRAFAQANTTTTRLYGGTGLGLVICKRIVDLMGGRIDVDSEVGRGTSFWFEIGLLKAAGDIQGQRADLNNARILLLSNDTPLRQRLQLAAPDWGAQLTLVETTQDALARLRSALGRGRDWNFDLLMVDLNSVRATAIALHRNLQNISELEDLRVVYLVGSSTPAPELNEGPHVLMLSRNMGQTELRTAIGAFIASASTPNVETAPLHTGSNVTPLNQKPGTGGGTSSGARMRGRVLLVEDNPVNQMVAQRLIGILGLSCETADNGEKALERMTLGNLDLVLMDCQMPVKDGYSAAREWREHEIAFNLPRLPIIAMTANAMAGDRQKCLDAGMDDYLSKPVDRRLLESSIERWLQRSPLRGAHAGQTGPLLAEPMALVDSDTVYPTARPASPAAAQPVATQIARTLSEPASAVATMTEPKPSAASAEPAAAVLSMDVIEELRNVMGQEYRSLIQLFLEDAPGHIQRLEAAAAANDIAAMVAPAHTLKSSSANLGALALSAAAKRIELGARSQTLPRPAVAVVMLGNEFRRAKAALQALLDR